MKAAALSTVLATLSLVVVAQARPDPTAMGRATTADKTITAGDHPSMTRSLDLLVKHLQNEGYAVSQVKREVNPDGTLKHYSLQGTRGGEETPASENISVEINMNPSPAMSAKRVLPPVPNQAATALPVSTRQFTPLLRGLSAESFDEGKIFYIMQVGRSHHFTSAQASKLLSEFDFDDERANAAIALYPYVVDPENFPTVLKVFSFDDGREAVIKTLKM